MRTETEARTALHDTQRALNLLRSVHAPAAELAPLLTTASTLAWILENPDD